MPQTMYVVDEKNNPVPVRGDRDGHLILADAVPVSLVRMVFYASVSVELAVIIYLLNEIVRSL